MEEFRREAALRMMVEFIKRPEVLKNSMQELYKKGQLTNEDLETTTTIDFAADRAVVFADSLIKRLEK
jgi:hypothetical protein